MPQYAKSRPAYGCPIAFPKGNNARFYPAPPRPAGLLSCSLGDIAPHAVDGVRQSGKLVFHTVGDTGFGDDNKVQRAIANAMQRQRDDAKENERPAFFYHLGDVVYALGESKHYDARFYKPYKWYDGPIVAIPGNHDGYGPEQGPHRSLEGWVENFLGQAPAESRFPYRQPMNLPYVHWELATEVVHILGLYSNVDGNLDQPDGPKDQQEWLTESLRSAPKDRPVIVAVHHPPYSFDNDHFGSPAVGAALDEAAQAAGRWPDLVLSAHVHAYQRFTRKVGGREIPYLVAGAGGRATTYDDLADKMRWRGLPKIKTPFKAIVNDPSLDVTLEKEDWDEPGFLTIEVSRKKIRCSYFQVPFDFSKRSQAYDRFDLNLATGRIQE